MWKKEFAREKKKKGKRKKRGQQSKKRIWKVRPLKIRGGNPLAKNSKGGGKKARKERREKRITSVRDETPSGVAKEKKRSRVFLEEKLHGGGGRGGPREKKKNRLYTGRKNNIFHGEKVEHRP